MIDKHVALICFLICVYARVNLVPKLQAGWQALIERKEKNGRGMFLFFKRKENREICIDENCVAVNLDYHFAESKIVPSRYLVEPRQSTSEVMAEVIRNLSDTE